jgi:hypothetical protein
MSRPKADPSATIIDLFLSLSAPERRLLVTFLAAVNRDQARTIEPTETERQAVKKRAAKTEETV